MPQRVLQSGRIYLLVCIYTYTEIDLKKKKNCGKKKKADYTLKYLWDIIKTIREILSSKASNVEGGKYKTYKTRITYFNNKFSGDGKILSVSIYNIFKYNSIM